MKRMISAVLAVLMLTVLLTACSGGNKLSGSYKASGMLTETTYTFAKDGSVTVRFTAANQVIIDNAKGTYSINEDGTQITLTLPESTKDLGALAVTIPTLSGDFAFSKGDGYIQIGSTQYNKAS